MSEHPIETPTLDRLTPELAAEVQRNLTIWLTVGAAGMAVFSIFFALAVGVSGATGGIAMSMFLLFLGLLVPLVGLLLTLVYLFGCWPSMLRARFLRDRYGVAAEDLAGPAWRGSMGSGGFWTAAGRGAIIGLVFVSAAVLAWWGLTGKWSVSAPSVILVILSAQFSARAWFVRRAVAQRAIPVPAPHRAVSPLPPG